MSRLAPHPTAVRTTAHLDIDAAAFARAFATCSTTIGHQLVDHPLLQLDAVAGLADRLPPDLVRRERGDLPLDNRGYVDAGAGPPSETVRAIAENGYRVSLREIQCIPEYRALIDECLGPVAEILGDREGGMVRRSGYVFVSSPAATTPMHFDPEHSFLLQVRGAKTVYSVPRHDRVATQHELDRYYDGRPCAFDRMQHDALQFELTPGVGVYFPSFVPHWVEAHAGVSISFSIPFYTRSSERAEYVNRFNTRLRKLHLRTRGPGDRVPVDIAKAALLRSWTRLRRPGEAAS